MNRKITVFALIFLLISIVVLEVRAQGQYVGSKNSDVYHYPSCHYVDNINEENKIWFTNAQDAVSQGYRPCKVCNPPLPTGTEPSSEPEPSPEPPTPEPPTPEPSSEPEPSPEPQAPEQPTADIISVFVTNVIDGDTFDTSEGYRIRFADIDAPEIGESGYLESAEYLELLVEDKTVILNIDSITGTDPYGRYVCLVFVEYNSTHYMNVNQALVIEGYANVDDYTNNEFDPNNWNLYYSTSMIPEFPFWVPTFVTLVIATISLALYKRKMKQ